jgi:predicted nucleotidyltransferase
MYAHQKETLRRISSRLRERFHEDIVSVYAFGSRVRGDHDERSDFDVLVVVKRKNPALEDKIMTIFVEEEIESGISFIPVIKDCGAFDLERKYNSPFYNNIKKEGIPI